MNLLQPERLDRLAREYALGTLAGAARRRFERTLRDAPAAARAVAAWQRRFDVLAAGVPAMAPRDAVWSQIETRLFGGVASASPGARSAGLAAWLGRLLSARVWAGGLAGVLLATVVLRLQPGLIDAEPRVDALPASYVGLLTDGAGRPTLLASSRRHGRQLTVKLLQPVAVPAGRVAQLWALPKDGGAPFAVGVVPERGSATVLLADSSEKLFFNVSQLAISFEASPARPGDAPTSPFVLNGHCVKLW